MLCQRQREHLNPSEDGQHDSPHLYQQIRRVCFSGIESPDKRPVAMVSRQEYLTPCHPPSWYSEHHSRRGIPCDERQDRLDVLPSSVHPNQSPYQTTLSGPVCISSDPPTPGLCELETRPRSNGNRCLLPRLDKVPGVCKPTMELGGQGPVTGQGPESPAGTSDTGVEIADMVPNPAREMSIQEPLLLTNRPNLIQPTHRFNKPDITPQLAVWGISGVDSKPKNFQRKLQSSSFPPGDKRRQSCMTPNSTSGWAGVTNGVVIPFQEI